MTYIPLMVHADDYLEIASLVRSRELTRIAQEPASETTVQGPARDYPFPMREGLPTKLARSNEELDMAAVSTGPRLLQPYNAWNYETCKVAQLELIQHAAWPREALEKFAASEVQTVQRWHAAMDFCAANPNTYFSTKMIVEATALELNEWRDAPRKLPAHLSRHYPEVAEMGWPLVAVSGREDLGLDHQVYWAMTGDVAEMWREIRGLELNA